MPARRRSRQAPGRSSPLAFVLREDLAYFLSPEIDPAAILEGVSSAAREVARFLEDHGASFITDIITGTRRLAAEVEDALWELVAHGLVSGDGVAGLRRLLSGGARERSRRHRSRMPAPSRAHPRALPVGRWALWRGSGAVDRDERTEAVARQLLRRYGVVFRELLARERTAPPWRALLAVYRRWEAQGRIRGGRFVSGFVGEQFALPDAVEALRAVRRSPEDPEPVVVSAADPLNLVGVVVPGEKVSPFSGLAVAYRSGAVVDVGPMGALVSRLQRDAGGPTPSRTPRR